ncbi:Crp/Fnr family transcriptional regulator [Azospirillum sp. RWY-5-1]|uniref:Crp/Fnr family transcriptional regulator n=1 Tax=Azospirillum oleiclasticum TaxID=2735135 RepID=A0ABX2TCV2_9PROT|nr:Crp/Fnr family transcriptional regulator [Azospirillum oleiclasticum]NYZ14845.1 Crp/Fnr family transcriptional regulator [Azospirillum oleiclasticum]NYZ22169.1 Crp/Fnr family transcriptional regulator [Azospirillum oleiclasticum]
MNSPCLTCDLRRKPLFEQLTDDELTDIMHSRSGQVSMPPKQDIAPSPRIGDAVCTLIAGWAFKYRRLPNGSRQILDILLPGEAIGLEKALTGIMDHHVQSLTPVTVCVLDNGAVQDHLIGRPTRYRTLIRTLFAKERRYENRLAAIGRLTAPQRIGYLMLEIFDRVRDLGIGNGSWVHFPLQRQHIADSLGLSGTHVNRSLTELRDRGLATLGSNMLVIHNRDALISFACYTTSEPTGCQFIL